MNETVKNKPAISAATTETPNIEVTTGDLSDGRMYSDVVEEHHRSQGQEKSQNERTNRKAPLCS